MRMTTKLGRRTSTIAVAGVLALAGVACGDDTTDVPDTDTTTEDDGATDESTDTATTEDSMTESTEDATE